MASMLLKGGLLAVTGSFVETKYGEKVNSSAYFGVTPLVLICTSFWATTHGMKVGQARKKYSELAKKDGEKDVDERYGLPNLYAQGTSKHARAFNCVQRSHQHIFESLTQVCLSGLVAAVSFPLTAAFTTSMYCLGRYKLSEGYAAAEGDPTKRYSSSLARYMWYGLVSTYFLGFLSSIKMIVDAKKK